MTVYLVGAGPGDPGLLTLRAAELLTRADVVVHDRLVSPAVLAYAAPHAELLDVGKAPGGALTQADLNALLVERSRSARCVVRLKGGDPFVFGRGGEEALALEAAGVEYEVVPGVSSFAAVPASAGVPVTHRGASSFVTLVTGHDPDALAERVDFGALAAAETLVVFMGGAGRARLAELLIAAGRSPSTPVLAVSAGTTPEQAEERTTLGELGGVELPGPLTVVVGAVAALRLRGYLDRPLAGWSVVLTRAEEQSAELGARLASLGAVPLQVPTIAIADPDDGGIALSESASRVAGMDWVVFSSVNAVERFFHKLPDARQLGGAKVAAIGAATAAALRSHGVLADLVPERYLAEGLVASFPAPGPGGGRVLYPRASAGRDVVPDGLRRLGWSVEVVEAYATIHPTLPPALLEQAADADAALFASSSAFEGYLEVAGRAMLPPVVGAIGPATAATIRRAGVAVSFEAVEHTTAGLIDGLVAHASAKGRPKRPRRSS